MKVLVSGATRNSCMAVIRGLAGKGCEIIGADERRLPFNIHSRHTMPYYTYPSGYGDDFVKAIIKIIEKEKPDVFLPVAGSRQISKHKQTLEKYTNVLLPDYESYMKAFDNQTTLEECNHLNIGCPEIWQETEVLLELKKNKNRNNPVCFVIKPRADIGGAKGLGIFHDENSYRYFKKNAEKYGSTFISEYIPGDPSNMRTVNMLFDANSDLVSFYTIKKIRQWPNSGGLCALAVSTHDPDLADFILPFFKKCRWQGIAEVEIKIDSRDQKPKVIEINPRFCGYIGFPIVCGVNFPWYMCQLINGEKPKPVTYPSGVQYINWSYYIKSVFSEWLATKHKKGFFTNIRRELKGKKITNTLEWYDWKVIAAKMLFELIDRGKPSDVRH